MSTACGHVLLSRQDKWQLSPKEETLSSDNYAPCTFTFIVSVVAHVDDRSEQTFEHSFKLTFMVRKASVFYSERARRRWG